MQVLYSTVPTIVRIVRLKPVGYRHTYLPTYVCKYLLRSTHESTYCTVSWRDNVH